MKTIAHLEGITERDGKLYVTFSVHNTLHKEQFKQLDKGLYTLSVSEKKESRTIKQNAQMWALLREIDVKINGKPQNEWDVYLMALERANAKCEYVLALPKAEELLWKTFRAIKPMNFVEVDGTIYRNYKCYYGSSKFTKQEMNLLIEAVLDIAEEVGINTAYYKELL